MTDTPKKWADIPEHEREAIIQWARLPEKHRCRVLKAGKNIEWWDGLAERAGKFKYAVAFLALLIGYTTGFVDWVAGIIEDRFGSGGRGSGGDGWPQ